jgi:hypothetical protein
MSAQNKTNTPESKDPHDYSRNNLDEYKESASPNKEELGSVTSSGGKVEWSPENETILVEWCDVAQCYKWMNSRAHAKYSIRHAWFTIPAITLSTISGTASFAQASLPKKYQVFAPMVIGTINIFIGIITTIQQYLKIAELNEAHRVSAISWDKYARNIRIELAKAPSERMDAGHFLKLNRQEYDRLMETSPSIPIGIINDFNNQFGQSKDEFAKKRFEELKKPDICNIIISAENYRHPWYKEINTNDNTLMPSVGTKQLELLAVSHELEEKMREIDEKEKLIRLRELSEISKDKQKEHRRSIFQKSAADALRQYKEECKKIDDKVEEFVQLHGRKPLTDEIIDNMRELVSADTLTKYLEKYTLEDATNNV